MRWESVNYMSSEKNDNYHQVVDICSAMSITVVSVFLDA